MARTSEFLTDRLCRPLRLGLVGQRGAGKTALLAMLYRESVGGRLPGVKLAAADTPTADFLADKILALEAGQPLPATLTETDLHFHLYHRGARIELLVKDYPGETINQQPVQDYLHDCDALWLCLESGALTNRKEFLQCRQEFEQVLEHYHVQGLALPVAILLTKADLLADPQMALKDLTPTCQALACKGPLALIAVSSLGQRTNAEASPSFEPVNLAESLGWLANSLQDQDEQRLKEVWSRSTRKVSLLRKGLNGFASRYPEAQVLEEYRDSLKELQGRQRRRRMLLAGAAAACLLVGLGAYDAVGFQQAVRFQAQHEEQPGAVLRKWREYRLWHPTRNLLRSASARAEQERLADWQHKAREQAITEELAGWQSRLADETADLEVLWSQFHQFCASYPELKEEDRGPLGTTLKTRRDEKMALRARSAYDDLISSEQKAGDLVILVAEADRFLKDFAGSAHEIDVRRRRDAYLHRLDERDIEAARTYSTQHPLDFATRRELFQRYIDKHAGGGSFLTEATAAVESITTDWDKHDFRAIRDHYETKAGDIQQLVTLCRTYLAKHPRGKFIGSAKELLTWSERVTVAGEYRVVLKRGEFEPGQARTISKGLKLSVELEVNGLKYGPSTIVTNQSNPQWDYEFPRKIRWKLGDPVRIKVTDHTWKTRVVFDLAWPEQDPVGMKLLAGEVWQGNNRLFFESDFPLVSLPAVE